MDRELLEQRKQMLTELVHDKSYVPMKAKEIAMLLNIPKAMRGALQEVLDGKIWKAGNLCSSGYIFRTCKRLWFCYCGRHGTGCVYTGG